MSSYWNSDDVSFERRSKAAKKAAATRKRREAIRQSIQAEKKRLEKAKQRAVEEQERKAAEEQADAEEWYAFRRRIEVLQAARIAANQRRDHLLPDDDLPF